MLSRFLPRALLRKPWPASSALPSRINRSELVEEEKTPYYSPDTFYPARLGEVLDAKYQIATKLGYGSGSTVWLARDLNRFAWQDEQYVAVKISSATRPGAKPKNELQTLRRIAQANPQHSGWRFVRKMVDSFTLTATNDSRHTCFVLEPLREPLWLFCHRFVGKVIPADILKLILPMMLEGLDYLHSECQIVHADLKPDNIMVKIEDPQIFARDALNEYNQPLPQKHADGRIIYLSRNNYGHINRSNPPGGFQITDFDHSVVGSMPHFGCIQAEVYRAPEVILDAGYTFSADIWSLGAMLWDLLERKALFKQSETGAGLEHNDKLHLAQITELLGSVPNKLLEGRRAPQFYDSEGRLKEAPLASGSLTFESTITAIAGEEKRLFIEFVKRMMKWSPEERSTAKELLDDPWLRADLT